MNRVLIVLLGLLLTSSGCGTGVSEPPALIGTLRSRHHTVHVHAGIRYTVEDAEGRSLASFVSDNELWALLPSLHRDLHEMLAGGTLLAGSRTRYDQDRMVHFQAFSGGDPKLFGE